MPVCAGEQFGARTVSEQRADQDQMVSHTSRYASVIALLAELTGNHSLGTIARRSWNWASYMSDEVGRVIVGPHDTSMWFSDGYGDFIRNTLHCLGANASWAPREESHILRSSSVVTKVSYEAARVRYSTYGSNGSTEKLSLNFVPHTVEVDGEELPIASAIEWDALVREGAKVRPEAQGWMFGGESGRELRIRHLGSHVVIQ